MAANKYTGVVPIKIGGTTYQLQCTWTEVTAMESLYGNVAPQLADLDVLANCASILMVQRHPEMTADKIRGMNPPVFVLQAAVTEAIRYGYFGPNETDTEDGEEAAPGAKKKRRKLFQRFMAWLSNTALTRNNSGG